MTRNPGLFFDHSFIPRTNGALVRKHLESQHLRTANFVGKRLLGNNSQKLVWLFWMHSHCEMKSAPHVYPIAVEFICHWRFPTDSPSDIRVRNSFGVDAIHTAIGLGSAPGPRR